MQSSDVLAFCVIQLFGACGTVAIQNQNVSINSDAIVFPKTDDTWNNLPFLHGINLNIEGKIQLTKTPIQISSEAFALDLISVSWWKLKKKYENSF